MNDRAPFWRIQLAAWTLYGVIHFLAAIPAMAPADLGTIAVIKLVRAISGLAISSLLPLLYRRIVHLRMSWIVIVAIVTSAVASQVWFTLDRTLMITVTNLAGLTVRWSWFPHGVELDYPFVLIAWSGAYFAVHFAQEAAARRRQALERELALREAQLAALQHQLSPHFLFNALNSLRSLIAEDTERAREMVTRLSRFLAATLGAGGATTLGEELQTLRAYCAIQKVRFEEALEMEIVTTPECEQWRVPAMVLQPLVENAIRYGTGENGGPLRVRVTAAMNGSTLEICVANTGQLEGRSDRGARNGVGLANTRARLAKFYGTSPRFELIQDGAWVRARISMDQPGSAPCAS
jgi:two-component system LytT family sensor kinase